MVVQITLGHGPQECAPTVVRETYRDTVEEQVVRAYLDGCMVLVAEDANAKLGPEWIKGDPHTISENGKLLASMIKRQDLALDNHQCVGGPITRRRIENGKEEASSIDFVLVCQNLIRYLKEAVIDSNQLYAFTKYTTKKGIPSVKRSDHYTILLYPAVKFGILIGYGYLI